MKLKASQLQAIAKNIRLADVEDVIKRIEKRIFSPQKREELIEKVETYNETKDPRDDIDLHESHLIYPNDERGDEFNLENSPREVDVEWSSHAQYRSDLRDVDSDKVNTEILDMIERMPKYRDDQKIKMQKGFGTAVVELDGRRPSDVEADVITVWK